jgi:hypothetical protein
MKRMMMMAIFGLAVAAGLLLPVITEAGGLKQNETLVRDAD